MWGKLAENVNAYLAKGSQAYVEGSLDYKQWTDKEGVTRYTTEVKAAKVQFLDNKKQGQTQQGQDAQAPAQESPPEEPPQDGPRDIAF